MTIRFGTVLTPREREIIERKLAGDTNKRAAFHLGIKEQTVKNHISVILTKTGAPNTVALAAEYVRQTISPPIDDRCAALEERVGALETAVVSLLKTSLGGGV